MSVFYLLVNFALFVVEFAVNPVHIILCSSGDTWARGDDVLVRAHPGEDQNAEVYICSEGAEKKTYYVAKLLGLGDGKDGLDIVRWYQVDSKNRRKYSLKCKFKFRVCFHFFSSWL